MTLAQARQGLLDAITAYGNHGQRWRIRPATEAAVDALIAAARAEQSAHQALRDFYEYHTVPYCDLSPERKVELGDIRQLITNTEAALRSAKCDEPAKPEVGPMQDAESLSGVQALGSSGLAQAKRAWPDPTPEMLSDPRFEAVWQCIKRWDISVSDAYSGYEGATGNHVRAILDAIQPAWLEIERLRSLVHEAPPDVDVQGVAAIAWRCIRECKNYEGPPVMCPAHQEEARALCQRT